MGARVASDPGAVEGALRSRATRSKPMAMLCVSLITSEAAQRTTVMPDERRNLSRRA